MAIYNKLKKKKIFLTFFLVFLFCRVIITKLCFKWKNSQRKKKKKKLFVKKFFYDTIIFTLLKQQKNILDLSKLGI